MNPYREKFFPQPSTETLPYWEGCARGDLLIQRCSACENVQFYPRIICTACMSRELEWTPASGRGEVLSFSVVHRAVSEAYKDQVPYIVALITLEEGPVLMSNLVDYVNDAVVIGMAVEVVFEKWSDEITVPQFKPVGGGES